MTAYLFYTKGSQDQRTVEALAEDLRRRQVDVELVDADTPHGVQMGLAHEVMARPAVLLLTATGSEIGRWTDTLPTGGDVSYLAHR